MTSTKSKITKRTSRKDSSPKAAYSKPALQQYGSIATLTRGMGGSVVDTSGPGTRPAKQR